MEATFEQHVQERAVLVGLNADCFTQAQTATDETLEELEAQLKMYENNEEYEKAAELLEKINKLNSEKEDNN